MNINNIESITNEMIEKERAVLASGGVTLAALVRRYIANWDRDIQPLCLATGRSYYDFLVELLASAGRQVDKQSLITTMNRIRKSGGGAK